MDAPLADSGIVSRQRWFFAALVAFFVVLNVQYLFKIQDSAHRSAFRRWTPQLLLLNRGVDIWKKHNYPNPPIMAMVLKPLAELGNDAGALVWFYLKAAMAILSIHWMLKMLDSPEHPFPFWGKAVAILLCLRPIEGDLIHGNVNLFILFLVMGGLYAFTRGRDWSGGLLLALAIACKVTPALFVPYFAWKRAWKMLAATALGLGIFLWLAPGAYFGWQKNERFLGSWYHVMVHPYLMDNKVTSEHQNQSLPGMLTRLLTDAPSFTDWEGDRFIALEHHNVADLDPDTVEWILKGCMAAFGLLVLWRCRTPIGERTNWRLAAEFGIVALGMLLFSERTWKHHGVVLLVPFAVLAYAWSALPLSRPLRWYVAGSVVLAALLMLATSTGIHDDLDRLGKLAQVYGAYVWAYLLLAAALFVLLGAPRGGRLVEQGTMAPHAAHETRPPHDDRLHAAKAGQDEFV
jgi:alpha-1,2-mannosyltransferase